jgi:hypothetical protein
VFSFILDRQETVRRSSQFLLHFLKVIITAIVCLAAVIRCYKFPDTQLRSNTGRESSGEWGRRSSVSQKKITPYIWLQYSYILQRLRMCGDIPPLPLIFSLSREQILRYLYIIIESSIRHSNISSSSSSRHSSRTNSSNNS